MVKNFQTRPVWALNNQQKPYRNCQSYQVEEARQLVNNSLCLPSSTSLSDDDLNKVIEYLNIKGKPQTLNKMINDCSYDIICILDVDDNPTGNYISTCPKAYHIDKNTNTPVLYYRITTQNNSKIINQNQIFYDFFLQNTCLKHSNYDIIHSFDRGTAH